MNTQDSIRHIRRAVFDPTETSGVYQLQGAGDPGGITRVLILFGGTEYPFERHYRYAHHRDKRSPYTFSNMEFDDVEEGLAVGPWPGWRGIPDFPAVTVRSGARSAPVTMMPWGDELTHRAIRGAALIDLAPGETLLCESGDPRLLPVHADLYTSRLRTAARMPVSLLPGLAASHPRLLFTGREIDALRAKARGSHRGHWQRILGVLDAPRLPWGITPESKILPGPERTGNQDRSMMAAFAALIDPTPERRGGARASVIAYVRETQEAGHQPLTIDTQAGETLFVLSLCYDWTYAEWTAQEREDIGGWLREVAGKCWSHLGYERRDYGQAHYLGCALGLLAYSFLFWEEDPRAEEWAAHLRCVLDIVIAMISPDGFYPHGINLWIYEFGFLLRWLELFRVCTGTDLWQPPGTWQNCSAFRSAATSADLLYGATFGDPQYRVGGDSWCHYLIAARTGSAHAQWLGERLREVPQSGVDFRSAPPRRRVYEFLFHDTSLGAEPPAEQISVFPDGGQVFARGKEHRTLFTFRSGAPLGRQRYRAGESGAYGHSDPANGSFLLFLAGGPAIRGPGPTYRRDTSLHNTITIDGRGQIGDSTVWLPDFFPPEVICSDPEITPEGERVFIRADMAAAYLPHLRVEECRRALCVDAERFIAGVDTVRCGEPRAIQWNLHASGLRRRAGATWAIDSCGGDRDGSCLLVMLDPPGGDVESGLTEMVPAYPNDGARFDSLRVGMRGKEAMFIWCVLLDGTQQPPRLGGEGGALSLTFNGGPTIVYRNGVLSEGDNDHRS